MVIDEMKVRVGDLVQGFVENGATGKVTAWG